MSRVLISIKHLVCSCFHLFHHGFLCWTRPLSASLLLGTLADLASGKSELSPKMHSYGKTYHPSSTEQTTSVHHEGSKPPGASGKGDAVLEAIALDRPARDPFAMASSGLSSFLEAQVESDFE